MKYSLRQVSPRAATCGCSRLSPSDGDISGPNGIETSRTSTDVVIESGTARRRQRRRLARWRPRAADGVVSRSRIAAGEVGVGLARLRRVAGVAFGARQLQPGEGVDEAGRLIAGMREGVAELARGLRMIA